MAKCPHCKEEIKVACAQGDATADLTKSGDIVEQVVDWTTYTCPKCDKELFGSVFDDVVEFLEGK